MHTNCDEWRIACVRNACGGAPVRWRGYAMYGLVNKALQDLVLSAAASEAWARIKVDAALDSAHQLRGISRIKRK